MKHPLALDSRPTRRPDITCVRVEGEAVLFDPLDSMLFRLDPIGSCLWDLLDGSADLAQLVTEVTEIFGADTDDVERDLMTFLEDLGGRGLLA